MLAFFTLALLKLLPDCVAFDGLALPLDGAVLLDGLFVVDDVLLVFCCFLFNSAMVYVDFENLSLKSSISFISSNLCYPYTSTSIYSINTPSIRLLKML